MFKRSLWLEKYGLVPKIFLAILFFVCLDGLDLVLIFQEASARNNHLYSHNSKLDRWDKPPAAYKGREFEDWITRKKAVEIEIKELVRQAKAKGDGYSLYNYFQDYEQLMVLEDKYNMYLTSPGMMSPLEEFIRLRDQKASWKRPEISETQMDYVKSIQTKISLRNGEVYSESEPDFSAVLHSLGFWLLKTYLFGMFFMFLVYLIRFQERKTARQKVQRYNDYTGNFYFESLNRSGTISLCNELLLCPGRFISRIIFWPFFFWKYPFYETTAEMMRYNRLKAEFLRYKPVGYQLTKKEDAILRSQAKRKVKNFNKTIKSVEEFQLNSSIVRRSLATAYLSLILGIVLQPAITFAAQYSDKVNDHFYGQSVMVQADQQQEYIDTGPDPPQQDDQPMGDDCPVLPNWFSWLVPAGLIIWLKNESLIKLKELNHSIDHVPRLVVLAARCQ